jgi:hypothetical protein
LAALFKRKDYLIYPAFLSLKYINYSGKKKKPLIVSGENTRCPISRNRKQCGAPAAQARKAVLIFFPEYPAPLIVQLFHDNKSMEDFPY